MRYYGVDRSSIHNAKTRKKNRKKKNDSSTQGSSISESYVLGSINTDLHENMQHLRNVVGCGRGDKWQGCPVVGVTCGWGVKWQGCQVAGVASGRGVKGAEEQMEKRVHKNNSHK